MKELLASLRIQHVRRPGNVLAIDHSAGRGIRQAFAVGAIGNALEVARKRAKLLAGLSIPDFELADFALASIAARRQTLAVWAVGHAGDVASVPLEDEDFIAGWASQLFTVPVSLASAGKAFAVRAKNDSRKYPPAFRENSSWPVSISQILSSGSYLPDSPVTEHQIRLPSR